MTCARWVPETHFGNTVFLEPILSMGDVPDARRKLTCYLCGKRNQGACIQCYKTTCFRAFHPTCGQLMQLAMESVRADNGEMKLESYCDVHTPEA